MNMSMPLYPLANGNVWTYKVQDGSTYTNAVTGQDGNQFTMLNSLAPRPVKVYLDDKGLMSDAFEEGNFQLFLAQNPGQGDTWECRFSANGLNSVIVMTVKSVGGSIEAEGKAYNGVTMVEAESKIEMNGNLMPLGFFTQYYYAEGVGLVLTTSSHGDRQALVSADLK